MSIFKYLAGPYQLQQDVSKLTFFQISQQPIIYNPHIDLHDIPISRQSFIQARLTSLKSLFIPDTYFFMSTTLFQEKLQITSPRIARITLAKILAAIPGEWMAVIIKAQAGLLSSEEKISYSSIVTLQQHALQYKLPFASYKKRSYYVYYQLCTIPETSRPLIKWVAEPEAIIDYNFHYNVYAPPTEKRHSDIQWRFLYRFFFPACKLHELHYVAQSSCLFCGEIETFSHIFITCPRLLVLFNILQKHMRYLYNAPPPPHWWLYGPPFVTTSAKMRMINWMIITAKTAIWLTRGNKMQSKHPVDVYGMYISLLQKRLQTEYIWFNQQQDVCGFKKKWFPGTFFFINHDHSVTIKKW